MWFAQKEHAQLLSAGYRDRRLATEALDVRNTGLSLFEARYRFGGFKGKPKGTELRFEGSMHQRLFGGGVRMPKSDEPRKIYVELRYPTLWLKSLPEKGHRHILGIGPHFHKRM